MKLIMENWRGYLNEEINSEQEAAQWLASQITPLVAAADAGNFTKPLAALVARLNTPDGVNPLVRDLLSRGEADAQPSDEVISVKMGALIDAPKLVPTQGVIDLFKSVGYNGSVAEGLKGVLDGVSKAPPILVAGSGDTFYIIDGHHRWSGATVFNTNCKIPANVITMNPGKALLISQLVIAAYVGSKPLPSATAKKGRSIIGPGAMSAQQVNQALLGSVGKVIDKRAGQTFMNPKVIAVVGGYRYGQEGNEREMGAYKDMQQDAEPVQELATPSGKLGGRKAKIVRGAIAKVAENCEKLAGAYSKEGPPREIMPQFDPDRGGPDFDDVRNQFSGGKINFKPAFISVKKAAE